MVRFLVVLSVCVMLLCGGYLAAQDKKEPADPPKPKGMLPPNWGKLGLSETQKEQIYKIQADYKAKIADLEKQIADLKSKERAEMVKVLTPEQKKKLEELTTGGGGGEEKKPESPK